MCLGLCLLFVVAPPSFFSFGSLCSGFLSRLRCLRGRLASSRLGVLVGSVLVPSLRRGSAFLLWGFPMLSSSSLPAFSSVGPVSAVPALPGSSLLPVSLAPLPRVSWSGVVRLARLGWEPSSSSVLVWVVGSSVPLVCRVGSSSRPAVSALVAELRALVRSGAECRLGVRGSWSGGKWFCAVATA